MNSGNNEASLPRSAGASPRSTTPALIRWKSTRHLVAEIRYSGKISTTNKQIKNQCRCRRISRATMGGRDCLFFQTVAYFLVMLQAAEDAIALDLLVVYFPAGFLPVWGSSPCTRFWVEISDKVNSSGNTSAASEIAAACSTAHHSGSTRYSFSEKNTRLTTLKTLG